MVEEEEPQAQSSLFGGLPEVSEVCGADPATVSPCPQLKVDEPAERAGTAPPPSWGSPSKEPTQIQTGFEPVNGEDRWGVAAARRLEEARSQEARSQLSDFFSQATLPSAPMLHGVRMFVEVNSFLWATGLFAQATCHVLWLLLG
jgi:hypothetical protein